MQPVNTPKMAQYLEPVKTAFRFRRVILAAACVFVIPAIVMRPAKAAQLAGVTLPDTVTVGTTKLALNGIGLRTYSAFRIHIYVAGLYLEHPGHDSHAIMSSPGFKMLRMHFLHDVSAAAARKAWQQGFIKSCTAPCTLSPAILSEFLDSLQPVSAGETAEMTFGPDGLSAAYNGIPAGSIHDTQFAQAALAVFVGPKTSTPELTHQLIGD